MIAKAVSLFTDLMKKYFEEPIMESLAQIESFLKTSDSLLKLVGMICELVPNSQDQEYVTRGVNKLIGRDDEYRLLRGRIKERLENESSLKQVASYINSQKNIQAPVAETLPQILLNFLETIENFGDELSGNRFKLKEEVVLYALSSALIENKENQRGGIPYDRDKDGEILLSSPSRGLS